MSNEQEVAVPTAATNILDLNDDCLREIFSSEYLSICDLCSVVETHSRFGRVVVGVFAKRFKKFDVNLGLLSSNDLEKRNTRRILRNFGPCISELSIVGCWNGKEFDLMLDLVTEYCSNSLESIKLSHLKITEDRTKKLASLFGTLQKISIEWCDVSSGKTLFTNCESLVDLELADKDSNDLNILNALTNIFPKLERFVYLYYGDWADAFSDSIQNDFFSRHQNLKTLTLGRRRGISDLLSIAADNCMQLAELDIRIEGHEKEVNVEKALSSILSLSHLKKLKIGLFGRREITKFIQELRHSNSLEFLTLSLVQGDSEFIPTLSKLTRLQGLALEYCEGLTNLNPLGDLERLTELKIVSLWTDLDLDVVHVIERLINLKILHLDVKNFELDQQTYLRIVDVVRGRPGRFPDALQVTCATSNDGSENSFGDANSRKIVKINKL